MVNKIMWGKYYTDSCSATIIMLSMLQFCKTQKLHNNTMTNNVTSRQRANVSDDCLQSVRHRTDNIVHSSQINWSPRFPQRTFECRQCLQLWAGINSCSYNAPNVFNRTQMFLWFPHDIIFTALHEMQTPSSDENSVCLSVRLSVSPSVKRVDCNKTE